MKFTINIPVTRKRTKQGYYLRVRTGGRFFFINKSDAIKGIRNDMKFISNNTCIMTASDYAKKYGKRNRPPT